MKYLLLLPLAIATGCASSIHPFNQDFLEMKGTPAAIEEFFTGMNGLSQTAKNNDVTQEDNHTKIQRDKLKVKALQFSWNKDTAATEEK
jgi:hypothetical protein